MCVFLFLCVYFIIKMYFVNWFYLKISKNYDENTTKIVSARKANSQVDESKLIKFSKPKNAKRQITSITGNKFYPSTNATVTILVKSGRHTVFLYYKKDSERFYYGITNNSIQIRPNKGIILLSYFIDDYSQAPFMIDFMGIHECRIVISYH